MNRKKWPDNIPNHKFSSILISFETFAKSDKIFWSVILDLFVSYRGFFGQFSRHDSGIISQDNEKMV